ncbi:MAG: TIGR03668 family PPOX class F420-dependent oxidoreductase [Thermomicrobiales bacterium]
MSRTSPLDARAWCYLAAHRVAHLTTVDQAGIPSVVPVCFATDGATIYSALDAKPKRVAPTALRRVRNLLDRPEVAFLVDDYAEDWAHLSYLLIHGTATLVVPGLPEHERAVSLLREKYLQYAAMPIETQPVIAVRPRTARYWAPDPATVDPGAAPARRLDLDAVMRGRRSVRAFRPDPVPRALVERVLDAARWAPSPHGRMPWRFAVITQTDAKARLADAMGDTWQQTLAMDNEPPEVVARRLALSHERVRGAPVLVLLCLYTEDLDHYPDAGRQAAETTMAIQSLGAAAENLLLAAYHLGLDGGWMCAPLFCPDTVRAALDLAPNLVPHAPLPLCYAAREPKRRPRMPLDALIVHWE